MKKKNIICAAFAIALMILLPLTVVNLIKGDAGMAVCFLLFFAVNPVAAVIIGIFAGKNIKSSWYQPLLLAGLFVAGTWLAFDMGEPDFLYYGAAYLLLGYAAAIITVIILKIMSSKKQNV